MTDKKIIEKLKISSNPDNIGCSPTHGLCREALNLIERQQAEIEELKNRPFIATVKYSKKQLKAIVAKIFEDIEIDIDKVRAEVVREFADDIKGLLKEAEQNSKNAACGYDEGWYNGEENAYNAVLKLFGNPEELKGGNNALHSTD